VAAKGNVNADVPDGVTQRHTDSIHVLGELRMERVARAPVNSAAGNFAIDNQVPEGDAKYAHGCRTRFSCSENQPAAAADLAPLLWPHAGTRLHLRLGICLVEEFLRATQYRSFVWRRGKFRHNLVHRVVDELLAEFSSDLGKPTREPGDFPVVVAFQGERGIRKRSRKTKRKAARFGREAS
jgi:hypothetical protein